MRIKRGLIFIVFLFVFIGLLQCGSAAIYYVSPSGNNNSAGTSEAPWQTIQYAANNVSAGDTVIVQSGDYSQNITIAKNGTLGNLISFVANGSAQIHGSVTFRGNYLSFDGFGINGNISQFSYYLNVFGSNNLIKNNYIINGSQNIYALIVEDIAENNTILNNTFDRILYNCISLFGAHNRILNNTIKNIAYDAIRAFGRHQVISGNYFNHIDTTGVTHADIIQTFSDGTDTAYNITFENNLITDSMCQVGNLEDKRNVTFQNWTFRNNIYINISSQMNVYIPNVNFYNNLFYNSGTGGIPLISYDLKYQSNSSFLQIGSGQVYNNFFVDVDNETSSSGGVYSVATPKCSGYCSISTGTSCFNTNSTCPLGELESCVYGTTCSVDADCPAVLTGEFCGVPEISADYNFMAHGTNYGNKTGYNETNGINGKNPLFMDPDNLDFRLSPYSLAINHGYNLSAFFSTDYSSNLRPRGSSWDIGPYEYLFSTPTVTLNSPVNYKNVSNNSIEFNCSVSAAENLTNITLYGNWSGGWHLNETVNIKGLDNSTTFTKNLSEGVYQWNCLAYDELNNNDFAISNYTFTVDDSGPIVTLISPENGSTLMGSNLINFTYNVSDANPIANCSIYLNNIFIQTDITTLTNVNQTFEYSLLETGNISWNVQCVDFSGNIGNSSLFNFEFLDITSPAVEFVSPTPANGSILSSESILINVSTFDINPNYAFVDFSNSLLGWWTMDLINGTGGVTDLSTWSINGTINGGAPQNDTGIFGKSFTFNGTDGLAGQHITIGNVAGLTFNDNSNFTISAWIYPVGLTASASPIFGKNNIHGYYFYVTTGGVLGFAIKNASGTSQTYTSPGGAFTINNWTHVLMTFTGSQNQNITFYVNGEIYSSSNFTRPLYTGSDLATIGYEGNVKKHFNGSIDEVLVFNRTLSSSEIAALYDAEDNPLQNNFTGLTNGTYSFKVAGIDRYGNINNSVETRYIILNTSYSSPDSTAPTVTLLAPINGTNTSTVQTSFNATMTDNVNLSNVTLYVWNSTGIVNQTTYTKIGTSNSSNVTFSFPRNGSYIWNYLVYDNSSNSAWATANFTITYDAIAPFVAISYPTNTSYIANVSAINYTFSDSNIRHCWYSNETTNSTPIICGTNFTNVVTREGSNVIRVYANDSSGNINSTAVTFFKDTILPKPNIVYPTNITYNSSVSTLNYTCSETGFAWYSRNGGTTNSSINACGTNFTSVTSTEGTNNWILYNNDSLGNLNYTNVTFAVITDTIYPIFSDYIDNSGTFDDSGTGNFNVTIANSNGTTLLQIDGTNYTATNLTRTMYNVSVSLTSGSYTYYWFSYGNGTSKNFNSSTSQGFSVGTSSSGSSGSSGGGGGGGGGGGASTTTTTNSNASSNTSSSTSGSGNTGTNSNNENEEIIEFGETGDGNSLLNRLKSLAGNGLSYVVLGAIVVGVLGGIVLYRRIVRHTRVNRAIHNIRHIHHS